jgi:hypothetical protein
MGLYEQLVSYVKMSRTISMASSDACFKAVHAIDCSLEIIGVRLPDYKADTRLPFSQDEKRAAFSENLELKLGEYAIATFDLDFTSPKSMREGVCFSAVRAMFGINLPDVDKAIRKDPLLGSYRTFLRYMIALTSQYHEDMTARLPLPRWAETDEKKEVLEKTGRTGRYDASKIGIDDMVEIVIYHLKNNEFEEVVQKGIALQQRIRLLSIKEIAQIKQKQKEQKEKRIEIVTDTKEIQRINESRRY